MIEGPSSELWSWQSLREEAVEGYCPHAVLENSMDVWAT